MQVDFIGKSRVVEAFFCFFFFYGWWQTSCFFSICSYFFISGVKKNRSNRNSYRTGNFGSSFLLLWIVCKTTGSCRFDLVRFRIQVKTNPNWPETHHGDKLHVIFPFCSFHRILRQVLLQVSICPLWALNDRFFKMNRSKHFTCWTCSLSVLSLMHMLSALVKA